MSLAATRRAAPADVTVSMVRWSGVATMVCLPLAAVVAWLLLDGASAAALAGTAAIGALLTGLTLTTGAWAVRWLLRQEQGKLVLPGAFMIAIAQLALLLAIVLVLRTMSWWQDAAMALGALVTVIVVQAALVLAYVRGRKPALEVEPW
ncbi:hypothetical protein ACQBAT_03470 [Ornithinimicrobium sp. Y1847]|uniref:hypothetical protein n=1 Tax=unclassified Ornithinimicrobium TaxID=2615080 RepID=UPI003B67579B